LNRTIWIFDFDGTLSPIIADRHSARLHPNCRTLLIELQEDHGHLVAVLSSRRLEDLTPRIDIPGLYLGGYNGLQWLSPEGRLLDHGLDFSGDLQEKRAQMLPEIMALKELPGMDIEDKHWAVTLHLRQMSPDGKEEALKRIWTWENHDDISVMQGPEAWELAFSPSFNKSVGVQILCRELDFQPRRDLLIYAGDDANDALAMAYVASAGGLNITIGSCPLVAGAHLVENPEALAPFCRKLAAS
jgi:trehalose-phosphatase